MNTPDVFIASPKKARLEIIPLIDVIFFLLATFVLFTLSLNKIRSLDVTLPVPSGVPPLGEDQTLYLQATDGGAFFWKIGSTATPDLISTAELTPRLADYARRVATPRVFIRGDARAKFGSTVLALDQVRLAGITQVSVETLVSPSGK